MVFTLHVHVVFVTKYRRGVISDRVREFLKPVPASVCTDFESELLEFDGEDDPVHLLVAYPPKVSISSLVTTLKGVSARMLRKQNLPEVRKTL